jgi:holo-[acyl-carrier protein] synthase
MSLRIGIDLVCAEEVQESVGAHGRRYLERVYTEQELSDCALDPRRLAARFAVKEATMKALGREHEPLPWRSISVHRDAGGQPIVQLDGMAAELARARGTGAVSVSMTTEGSRAAAVVLIEDRS